MKVSGSECGNNLHGNNLCGYNLHGNKAIMEALTVTSLWENLYQKTMSHQMRHSCYDWQIYMSRTLLSPSTHYMQFQ